MLRGRFGLPLGDTHPTAINFSSIAARGFPPPVPPAAWASEELAGFGAILQRSAGTPAEAFLALKASPNRIHYHGDQLSVHYASHGARIVIDIMAGYNPRPYQESWHNRLCFGAATAATTQNADAYERLVAFAAGRAGAGAAAVAVGQLTSTRLQTLPANPPQPYLAVYPYTPLAAPLTYRRTAVLVPGDGGAPGARDYVVLVDAHNASALGVGAYGALCFFQQDGVVSTARGPGALDMGNGTVFVFAANAGAPVPVALVTDRWDWPSEGNESATRVRAFPAAGASAPTTLFVTLLYPDGSLMPPVAGAGGGGASTPAVSFDPARGALTVACPSAPGAPDVLQLAGLATDASAEPGAGGGGAAAPPPVTLTRAGGAPVVLLDAADVDLDRSQGEIGLAVTDAGYTFGEVPAWVLRQRGGDGALVAAPPEWPWPPGDAAP